MPHTDYNFSATASNDILGIVLLEIKGATDLPKLKNSESPCLLVPASKVLSLIQ